jgi:hypothetical protein
MSISLQLDGKGTWDSRDWSKGGLFRQVDWKLNGSDGGWNNNDG